MSEGAQPAQPPVPLSTASRLRMRAAERFHAAQGGRGMSRSKSKVSKLHDEMQSVDKPNVYQKIQRVLDDPSSSFAARVFMKSPLIRM